MTFDLGVRTRGGSARKREKGPFELDVEHFLRRKAHGEMLELRGIWWGGRRHARSDDGSKR